MSWLDWLPRKRITYARHGGPDPDAAGRAPMLPISVRYLIRSDHPAVLAIDREAYGDAAWTEAGLVLLTGRAANVMGVVAEAIGPGGVHQIVGYCVYHLQPPKGEIDLLAFVVEGSKRRRRVGAQLLDWIARRLRRGDGKKWRRLKMNVRETDLAGQLFLRAQGWRAIAVESDAFGEGRAAYVFEYRMGAK